MEREKCLEVKKNWSSEYMLRTNNRSQSYSVLRSFFSALFKDALGNETVNTM
jgi:hypothetical protein